MDKKTANKIHNANLTKVVNGVTTTKTSRANEHIAQKKKAKKKTAKKKTTKKKTIKARLKESADAIDVIATSNRNYSTPTSKKKTQKKKVVKKKATKKKAIKIEKNQSTGKRINNGGARKGSGRKKGATTKKTRAIADKLAESDEITPLEYMLGVLRETPEKLKAKYDAGELSSEEFIVELQAMQKRKDNAAEKAAPYIHPRLSSIEAKVTDNAHERWLALMESEK